MVSIPGRVHTRKQQPQYTLTTEVAAPQPQKAMHQRLTTANKLNVHGMRENDTTVHFSNNVRPVADSQRTQQSTSGLSTHPIDDADPWAVFANNVHIAATMDNLSQHFSKFGEILQVIINTDAATGQPAGSAVIEFGSKESADHALSLDGTSFMSRVLKVTKRSLTALQKPPLTTAMTRPRAVWGSPYARFPRAPFPWGILGGFRSRPPMRGAVRSLQWKRDSDAQPASAEACTSAAASSCTSTVTPFITNRRFTYVRAEAKPEVNVVATRAT